MAKILQFLNNNGFNMGGVEQSAINYSKSLISQKSPFYTIIPNKNTSYHQELAGEVFKVNIGNKLKLFISLLLILRKIKPNIVILHCSRGLKIFKILSFFYNFKIIGVNHGFNLKKFAKYADIIFCINTKQIEDCKKIVKNPQTQIIYFPHIVDVKKFIKYREIGQKVIIGTLSRIDFEYKNLDKVVLAAKIMKDKDMNFAFHIGGDFGEIEKLKKMVSDCDLENNFVFKGFIKDKDRFFGEIDIFCMPSKNETFGISYIEAMARGVPMIATNNDGAKDIIKDKESGILIDKNNPEQLPFLIAGAIEFLIKNPDIKKQITQNAFLKVGNDYSYSAMIKRFDDILNHSNKFVT